MVEVGTATAREKELKRDWPHESGITAGTTKQEGRELFPESEGINGVKSIVPEKEKVGINE